MRFSILSGLVTALWLSAVGSRAADEPKPLAPKEMYLALVKAQGKAQEEFDKAIAAAMTNEERQRVDRELGRRSKADYYARDFLTLIKDDPQDPAALDASRWLLARLPHSKETDEAVDLLIRDWIKDPRLESVCAPPRRACPAADRLLRAAIEKSPHRTVQGLARYGLAVSLNSKIDRLAGSEPSEAESCEREAEQLLQQVIDKYADLKHVTALGEQAELLRFQLRRLGVGKTVADVEADDLDGRKMKLADFRGKVTLVVFWASWCGPCMGDVPHELALLKQYEGKAFAIVGVNCDKDRDTARKAVASAGIAWRSFQSFSERENIGGPIGRKWNVTEWPTLYLLDGDGVVRFKGQQLRTLRFKPSKNDLVPFLDEAVERLITEAATKKPQPRPATGSAGP
jgi:thiol-disulfide isomerase/thioredoxin